MSNDMIPPQHSDPNAEFEPHAHESQSSGPSPIAASAHPADLEVEYQNRLQSQRPLPQSVARAYELLIAESRANSTT